MMFEQEFLRVHTVKIFKTLTSGRFDICKNELCLKKVNKKL